MVRVGAGDDLRYLGSLTPHVVRVDIWLQALARCPLPPGHKFVADMQDMHIFRIKLYR